MTGIQISAVLAGLVALVSIAASVAIARHERRKRRIQLPARLLDKVLLPPGYLLTVEFPGPDGHPRRTTVMSAIRRGIGATPEFQGWVWVDRDDPSDVVVRPNARYFWPVFLGVLGAVALVAAMLLTSIAYLESIVPGTLPPPAPTP